jgi:diguanylate cyclase (GGDEF)-like protein
LMIVSMSFLGFFSFIQYYALRLHANKIIRNKGIFLAIFSIVITLFTSYGVTSSQTQLFDFSAFVLSGFSLLAFFVSYRQELFDLVPKAYKMAFENEQVPLLILDKTYMIIKANLAAKAIFPNYFKENQVVYLNDLFEEKSTIYKELISNRSVEYVINDKHFFDVKLKGLHSRDFRLLGYLISMQDITHHKTALRKMENIASIDELTNIYNRRYFFKEATRLFDEAVSKHQIMSIIMFDLDHFKDVNDIYGHQAGDYVLEEMAKVFSSILDLSDVFARYGGEEFIIYRPSKNVSDSKKLALTLCQTLHQYEFHFQNRSMKVSASFGVSGANRVIDHSLEQYIKIADVALYKAKTKGKNRVECG